MYEFGNVGHLIELDKYWEPDPIPAPIVEEYSDRNEPLGLKKADLMETVEARCRHIEEMKSKHSSFFAVLYGQLSSESEEKVKQCASWNRVDLEKDPLGLWKCI